MTTLVFKQRNIVIMIISYLNNGFMLEPKVNLYFIEDPLLQLQSLHFFHVNLNTKIVDLQRSYLQTIQVNSQKTDGGCIPKQGKVGRLHF